MLYQYRCLHCGDAFDSDKKLRIKHQYCGYCNAVLNGPADPSWLPSIRDREDADAMRKRGLQRIP